MRSIAQPGSPATERIQWVEARGRAFSFTLEAGIPLLEAARRGFAVNGFGGGVLNANGGALGPFDYVMPALSKDGANALRQRPNQDFACSLETFCRQHGIIHARLHGGVGSTIGACFTDGRTVVPFATELAMRSGSVAPGPDGTLHADLDIALVDYLGGIAEGKLIRGDNPVLMTMELVLEVLGEEGA